MINADSKRIRRTAINCRSLDLADTYPYVGPEEREGLMRNKPHKSNPTYYFILERRRPDQIQQTLF